MAFAKKAGYLNQLQAAQDEYLDELYPENPTEMDDSEFISFLEWFVLDRMIPKENKSLAQLFLKSNPKLPIEEMQVLRHWQDSVISVYEVGEINKGAGFQVRDLFSGQECFVSDAKLSQQAKPGHLLITRLTEVMGEYHASPAVGLAESKARPAFLRGFDSSRDQYIEKHPGADLQEFLKHRGFTLNSLLVETAHAAFPGPQLVTTSGEEPIFQTAHYDLLNRTEAITRLDQAEDFSRDQDPEDSAVEDELEYVWLDQGESAESIKAMEAGFPSASHKMFGGKPGKAGSNRLLGWLTIQTGRLTVQVNGQKRFALGKKRLEALLAGLIEHRLDSVESLEAAMAKHRARAASAPPPESPPPADFAFEPVKPGESIQDALKNREFGSLDEANAFLQKAMGDYNNCPQEEMGGLSPAQVRNLMDCDWEDKYGPLRLNRSLPLADLDSVPILHNTRLLLSMCEARGGVKATGSGYLGTVFVRDLVAKMIWPPHYDVDEFIDLDNKRIRETDIHELMLLRTVLEFAGLLKRNKSKFVVSEKGKSLLTEEQAGELFATLFVTFFRVLDLDGLDPICDKEPSIQQTLAYSFHSLTKLPVDGRWLKLKDVIPAILLPSVKSALTGKENHQDWGEEDLDLALDRVQWRVIDPLYRYFGLLEWQEKDGVEDLLERLEVRPTPLLARFLSFNL